MKVYLHFMLILLYSSCHVGKEVVNEPIVTEKEIIYPVRLSYGADLLQFGDLRVPDGDGPFPVLVIIHGGCWLSQYDLSLMDEMAEDLTARGYATWNLEYRRTEDQGGGWPGTFLDVANGLNYIKNLAKGYPIDESKVVVMGHSAGGHLALWLGSQEQLPEENELKIKNLLKITGIISLAGITDLESYDAPSGCGSNVRKLMGGPISEFPNRYAIASPINLIPLEIPQILITGKDDNIVSVDHIAPYYNQALSVGDPIRLITIPDAGHFEVITPGSVAWPHIVQAVAELTDN